MSDTKYQILVLEYMGYGFTKSGHPKPFYGKMRRLTFDSEKTIDQIKTEMQTIFHRYRIQLREISGYTYTKTGSVKPKVRKSKGFALKTNLAIEEVRAEIARKLSVPIRKPGRPRKKKLQSSDSAKT